MYRTVGTILCLLISLVAYSLTGEPIGEPVIQSSYAAAAEDRSPVDQKSLFLGYLGIAVATIVDVKTEKWSTKLPPLAVGRLNIENTIRGNVPDTVHFVPLFYATADYDEASADLTHWHGKAFADMIGKKWIIIANGNNVTGVYPYSEQTVHYIREHMTREGLDDDILMVLFLVIIGFVFVPLKWAVKLGDKTPLILLMVQLAAYGIYEWGTPEYYNIRADLLVIIPALIINGLLTMRFDLSHQR